MKWNEGIIASVIARETLAGRCMVLVDRCNWTGHECDLLGVTRDLRIIDVEVKISRSDFKADARKEKWWHRMPALYAGVDERGRAKYESPPAVARLHPPKVWKHYFAMPAEIWTPDLVEFLPSPASGVILIKKHHGRVFAYCERRAKPCRDAYRLKPEQVMDIARLGNLRMWDAYRREESARRELAEHREAAA